MVHRQRNFGMPQKFIKKKFLDFKDGLILGRSILTSGFDLVTFDPWRKFLQYLANFQKIYRFTNLHNLGSMF